MTPPALGELEATGKVGGVMEHFLFVYFTFQTVMWIRIRNRIWSDPDSFGSVDPDSESGSGFRGIKSLIK